MRLIDADKLKKHFAWWHEGGEDADRQAEIFEQIIDAQPTIMPEEPGEWIDLELDDPWFYMCSLCKKKADHKSNFCPNCGARMEVNHGMADNCVGLMG